DGARRERREVGAGARLGEELAPDLVVADDRRQEACLLLVGAPRQDRGPGEVEPEDVEPAQVERRELPFDRACEPAAECETAVFARPHRRDEADASEVRVPGLVVGAWTDLAQLGVAAARGGLLPLDRDRAGGPF